MENSNPDFWNAIDTLVRECQVIIDRPKASHHPRFPEIVYPVDYGYLKGTTSMDGHGVDVWRGSDPKPTIDAVICTVDLRKKDVEVNNPPAELGGI